MKGSFYETIEALSGNKVTRLKSALFYWSALFAIILGIIFIFTNNLSIGIAFLFTIAPCLLLYPLVRFMFGGKDSVVGAVATIVIEEFVKGKITRAIDKSSNKKRKN